MACFWVAFLLGHLTLAALILLLQTDVSLIIAIGAGADLISRIFLAISSTCLNIKARYVYLAGALFTIVARFGNYLKSIHHPGRNFPVIPLSNRSPASSARTEDGNSTNTSIVRPYPMVSGVANGIQPRMRSPPLMAVPNTESTTTVSTKRTTTKPKATKKSSSSTKKRTLTTRRGRLTTATRSTTTASGTKRFRAAVQRRPIGTASRVRSSSATTKKGFRSKVVAVGLVVQLRGPALFAHFVRSSRARLAIASFWSYFLLHFFRLHPLSCM